MSPDDERPKGQTKHQHHNCPKLDQTRHLAEEGVRVTVWPSGGGTKEDIGAEEVDEVGWGEVEVDMLEVEEN